MSPGSTGRAIPIIAFVTFCSAVAARESAGAGPADQVPWKDVLASIESTICSRSVENNEGRMFYYASIGSREECGLAMEPSKLDPIVDAAFVDARPLTGSLQVAAVLRERLATVAPEERDRAARDAYVEEPGFLRALVPRIEARMREAGLACDGCPVFPGLKMKTISYPTFRPYLEAYIWPDEVTDRLGEKSYSFHMCAGINGVGQMENPDPDLVRAGFVVVFASEAIQQRARQVFRDRTAKRDLERIATDRERTDLLRREVPAAVFSGKTLLSAVCQSLDRFENDLGLRLAECH